MTVQKTALALAAVAACTRAFAALPGPVVDSAWLARNIGDVQVVDVRSNPRTYTTPAQFETDKKTGKKTLVEVGGHIEGSLLVPFGQIRAERVENGLKIGYMIPEKSAFEKLMQSAGLTAGKPIVLVPIGQGAQDVDEALRLYWQMKYFGEDQVAVLNGGMASWLAEGREAVVTPPAQTIGSWRAAAERKELAASSEEVATAAERQIQLVDSRPGAQFLGLSKQPYVAAFGHIKGARSVTPDLLFRSEGPAVKFYSPETYRAIYAANGLRPEAPSVTYCNSGHLAAGTWFIQHEILGNRSVQLYDGSMHKWALEQRPVERIEAATMAATCSSGTATPGC
ncbi:MAG: sulfurtransferase [Ignavibacteria bacterium]